MISRYPNQLTRVLFAPARFATGNLEWSADLTGATFDGANMTLATLSGAKLYGAKLCGAILSGALFSGADLYL